jgi:tetratricopeptide (TPR) repeat protein
MQKTVYHRMKRLMFISTCLVLVVLATGCIRGTGDQTAAPPPPPVAGPDRAYTGSGVRIALAVSPDGISTPFPEARELFFKGLTASTQYARYNESLEYFDQALWIDQNFSEAWYAKGVALHTMMRYDEAIQCYTRALAIDPENAAVLSLKESARAGWDRQHTSEKKVPENT